ncbi:hypothetical protein C8F01DRAFT_1243620 [Mycena amicta]|nr:hypothetical protein C8F01DRAFT_1243620 [Mycena amicta]
MQAAHGLCTTLVAALFFLNLITCSNSQSLYYPGSPLVSRKTTQNEDVVLSKRVQSSSDSLVEAITLGVSLTIAIVGVLVAITFLIIRKRVPQRQVELSRPHRPAHVRLDSELPIMPTIKPAYLESPRTRRPSIVIVEPLSPLQASRLPGYMRRPIPPNIPVSVGASDIGSIRTHWRRQSGFTGSPEELDELAEELANHYVLTNPAIPRHGHRHSTSLTGRSRERV